MGKRRGMKGVKILSRPVRFTPEIIRRLRDAASNHTSGVMDVLPNQAPGEVLVVDDAAQDFSGAGQLRYVGLRKRTQHSQPRLVNKRQFAAELGAAQSSVDA